MYGYIFLGGRGKNVEYKTLKAVGVTRKCDALGRVVIPKEMVKSIGYTDGQQLRITVDGDYVVMHAVKENEIGLIRKLDPLNRIVVPKSMRDNLGIGDGVPIEFYVSDTNDIALKVFSAVCALCGGDVDLSIVKNNKRVCRECVEFIVNNCV